MISQAARDQLRAKITELQKKHGTLKSAGKCDHAFRAAFPDHFELHDWRNIWNEIEREERRAEKEQKPKRSKRDRSADTAENGGGGSA